MSLALTRPYAPDHRSGPSGTTKVGIDCPLGWPSSLVSALTGHQAFGPWPHTDLDYDDCSCRLTDAFVREKTNGPWPLSVSADKLDVVAVRCARILSGVPGVDRTGRTGPVVEVYPAAALRQGASAAARPLRSTAATSVQPPRSRSCSTTSPNKSELTSALFPPPVAAATTRSMLSSAP